MKESLVLWLKNFISGHTTSFTLLSLQDLCVNSEGDVSDVSLTISTTSTSASRRR